MSDLLIGGPRMQGCGFFSTTLGGVPPEINTRCVCGSNAVVASLQDVMFLLHKVASLGMGAVVMETARCHVEESCTRRTSTRTARLQKRGVLVCGEWFPLVWELLSWKPRVFKNVVFLFAESGFPWYGSCCHGNRASSKPWCSCLHGLVSLGMGAAVVETARLPTRGILVRRGFPSSGNWYLTVRFARVTESARDTAVVAARVVAVL